MKFINYLESIAGIEVFPLISLTLFFSFFVVLTIWVLKVDKKRIMEMKNIPMKAEEIEKLMK